MHKIYRTARKIKSTHKGKFSTQDFAFNSAPLPICPLLSSLQYFVPSLHNLLWYFPQSKKLAVSEGVPKVQVEFGSAPVVSILFFVFRFFSFFNGKKDFISERRNVPKRYQNQHYNTRVPFSLEVHLQRERALCRTRTQNYTKAASSYEFDDNSHND